MIFYVYHTHKWPHMHPAFVTFLFPHRLYTSYIHVCMIIVCVCVHEAQHQVMVVGKLIFLLVSPHTEIMGVTQNNFYRLHLGFMNNFFFGFSCTNY